MKLRDILGVLRDSYCRTVGIEYMHIQDPEQRRWIQQRVEQPPTGSRRRAAAHPAQAQPGRGVRDVPADQVRRPEAVLARGRRVADPAARRDLQARPRTSWTRSPSAWRTGAGSTCSPTSSASLRQIFREFEGNIDPRTVQGSGDVKYHLGADGQVHRPDGEHAIKVSLVANPSHLEAVNPVLEGIVRAKQDVLDRGEELPVLPVLMHGDAAFAGQGVVAETLNLSQLRGYRTGGTIHVVVNNQVGFTTSPKPRPLVALLHRRRADGPGPDLPRQRRRPRGGASGWRGSRSSTARRSTRTSSST
jgi:multifunctional 2-oxoglutarate metabolism enzyme